MIAPLSRLLFQSPRTFRQSLCSRSPTSRRGKIPREEEEVVVVVVVSPRLADRPSHHPSPREAAGNRPCSRTRNRPHSQSCSVVGQGINIRYYKPFRPSPVDRVVVNNLAKTFSIMVEEGVTRTLSTLPTCCPLPGLRKGIGDPARDPASKGDPHPNCSKTIKVHFSQSRWRRG